MYGYISGTIKEVESNYIIIDNHGIGYLIYVPNPYGFMIDKDYTIYTYSNIIRNNIICKIKITNTRYTKNIIS